MRIDCLCLLLILLPGFAPAAEFDVVRIDRDRVLREADAYLTERPITVTAYRCPRSAGGVHDFYSEGDYWWPDPKRPDGPYIRRDGMTNPDNFVEHRRVMIRMSRQVAALTAAWRITRDARYARHAIDHLRAWFVTPATRMNPDLRFAQAIHGVTTGRGVGIIDTIQLVEVARAIEILDHDGMLNRADSAAIRNWFADYLRWMTTSRNGLEERKATNNHGTCWVMQAAAFAHLVGDEKELAACRRRFREVLLPSQTAADGSFPRELARTKPYCYSLFNLDAMATICRICSVPGDDLWKYSMPDGRSMRRALEFMEPFVRDKSKWPHGPDVMFGELWPVRSAAWLFGGLAYDDPKYLSLWRSLPIPGENPELLRNLPIREPILWTDDVPRDPVSPRPERRALPSAQWHAGAVSFGSRRNLPE